MEDELTVHFQIVHLVTKSYENAMNEVTAQQSSNSVYSHMLEDGAPNNETKILLFFIWKIENRRAREEYIGGNRPRKAYSKSYSAY